VHVRVLLQATRLSRCNNESRNSSRIMSERVCTFHGFSQFRPFDLQEEIVSRIKDPSPEIKKLISISKVFLLSNKDILDLIDFLIQK